MPLLSIRSDDHKSSVSLPACRYLAIYEIYIAPFQGNYSEAQSLTWSSDGIVAWATGAEWVVVLYEKVGLQMAQVQVFYDFYPGLFVWVRAGTAYL